MRGSEEILPAEERRSAVTSQSIGVAELATLLAASSPDASPDDYARMVQEENILGLKTATSREWRVQTLRRLYQLRPDSVLFRALRDLWVEDPEGHALLVCLAAMTRDTVFRATAEGIFASSIGDECVSADLIEPIEQRFAGAYKPKTLKTIAAKAFSSWEQAGHLGPLFGRSKKLRTRAVCTPATVAYALLLGHLEGSRGEALFDTVWARILDRPRSHVKDLAAAASQRGMLEYRSSGSVIEVGFAHLLRPIEGELT